MSVGVTTDQKQNESFSALIAMILLNNDGYNSQNHI